MNRPNYIRKGGVRIIVTNLQKNIPVNLKDIKDIVVKTLKREGNKSSGEINISFVTDKKIRRLNLRYLKKAHPTDVLAFNLSHSPKRFVGEIIISGERAQANSRVFNTDTQYELCLYVVHGLLHLLGYDDKTIKERRLMQEREKEILKICRYIKPKP